MDFVLKKCAAARWQVVSSFKLQPATVPMRCGLAPGAGEDFLFSEVKKIFCPQALEAATHQGRSIQPLLAAVPVVVGQRACCPPCCAPEPRIFLFPFLFFGFSRFGLHPLKAITERVFREEVFCALSFLCLSCYRRSFLRPFFVFFFLFFYSLIQSISRKDFCAHLFFYRCFAAFFICVSCGAGTQKRIFCARFLETDFCVRFFCFLLLLCSNVFKEKNFFAPAFGDRFFVPFFVVARSAEGRAASVV